MGIFHFVATVRRNGQRGAPVQVRHRWTHWLPLVILILVIVGCSIGKHVFSTRREFPLTPATYGLGYQEVWFTSADGVQLNGWHIPGNRGAPTLLFFHGNGGNLSDNIPYINLLHVRGFSVFIFDYRGFGRSRGRATGERDLYQDARGALRYVESMGWRHESTIYYGQSLGGAVALQLALEARPRALVMESTFTTLSETVKHVAPLPYYIFFCWCIDFGFDNTAKIRHNRAPLFVIHGDQDPVTPVRMGQRLYAMAPQPKMLYIMKGGKHCDAQEVETTSYLEAWSRFLATLQTRTASRAERR